MKVKTILPTSVLLTFGLLGSGLAFAKQELPEINEDGLHLVKDTKLAVVYAEPDAELSQYQSIWLLEPYIAFKKNWKRDQNRSRSTRVTDKDMERIKNSLKVEFHEVFAEVLQENDGYLLVEEAGEDVLLIRPAIVNLDATAPDTMSAGRSRSYAESAGEMTLYVEIYDSITNDLIAKALDRRHDRQSGFMTWQSSASNKQAAKRILRGWAQVMRDALDEAHAATAKGE